MQAAIQTNVWSPERHQDLPSLLAEIHAAGYRGFEIGAHRLDLSRPAQCYHWAIHNELNIVGIHAHGELHSAEWAQGARDYLAPIAAFAANVNALFVPLSGTPQPNKNTDDLAREADILNQLGEVCRTEGVRLVYHNHDWEIENDARELRYLVAHTEPSLVSLLLDVGWVHRAGGSLARLVPEWLPRIRYFHVKDNRGDQFTELGRGVVPFRELFDAIRGKDFWLVVERDEVLPNALASAVECREFLRQQLGI